jgi:Na+/proline symporter
MNISTLDLIITAIYLVGITAIGVFTGYKKKTTSEEYFLAGKSLGWFSIGSACSPPTSQRSTSLAVTETRITGLTDPQVVALLRFALL